MARREHPDLEAVRMRRYQFHVTKPKPVYELEGMTKTLFILATVPWISNQDATDQGSYCLDAPEILPSGYCKAGFRIDVAGRIKTFVFHPIHPLTMRT